MPPAVRPDDRLSGSATESRVGTIIAPAPGHQDALRTQAAAWAGAADLSTVEVRRFGAAAAPAPDASTADAGSARTAPNIALHATPDHSRGFAV